MRSPLGVLATAALSLALGGSWSSSPSPPIAVTAFAGCSRAGSAVKGPRVLGHLRPPQRPWLPERVPRGWRLIGAHRGSTCISGGTHALYLGPRSTLARGPAFVVGITGDDQWSPRCSNGEFPLPDRWGHFNIVTGPQPSFVSDAITWAVGRDIDRTTLHRILNATRWEGQDGQSLPAGPPNPTTTSVLNTALPEGFHRVAASSLGPGEQLSNFEELRFATPHGVEVIYAATGNTPALSLARFWSKNLPSTCPRRWTAPATFVVGQTVITTLHADHVTPATRSVIRSLRPTSNSEWRRTTARVIDPTSPTTPVTSGPR